MRKTYEIISIAYQNIDEISSDDPRTIRSTLRSSVECISSLANELYTHYCFDIHRTIQFGTTLNTTLSSWHPCTFGSFRVSISAMLLLFVAYSVPSSRMQGQT